MRRIVIALPSRDFDLTEVVVPWNTFRRTGFDVVFATEDGRPGACDPLLLTGVVFGQLGALPENVTLYEELEQSEAFRNPIRYDAIDPERFEALVLPGGHAPGMRQYLESKTLQERAGVWLRTGKPLGAICHGVIVLARTVDPASGKSVLQGRTVTTLTKVLERTAYYLTFWRRGRYYRTYPAYVQDEVEAALGDTSRFRTGPLLASYERPFVVEDGSLVTARWPGDASGFSQALLAHVQGPGRA